VRHGQGTHNLPGTLHMELDTNVTALGKEQAIKAGKELYTIMKQNGDTLNYTFASDLMRTRQTIIGLYEGIKQSDNEFKPPSSIIILPCSHELDYSPKGNCDKYQSVITGRENYPKCSISSINNITKKSDCNEIELSNTKITVDWEQYLNESYNKGKLRKMDCSTTNMIQIAIEIINKDPINMYMNLSNEREQLDNHLLEEPNEQPVEQGGKRRSKTRKRSNKSKSKKSKGGKRGKSGKRSKNKRITRKQKRRTHKK
jgi:bisphosphoglycerate-dependent phosphoglycerate mutase